MPKNTLPPETIERVCRLNAYLTDAAHWIENRAEQTQAAYLAGGGKDDWQQGELWEDHELEAIVKCSCGNNDPAFKPNGEYDNMIAVCEDSYRYADNDADSLKWSSPWDEDFRHNDIIGLREIRFCYLFHEIFEHTLHNDLESLMRIGEIEINLVLTRQRGINLDKEQYQSNIFNQILLSDKRKHLTEDELYYANLLNQKMSESCSWIKEQAKRSEKEYRDIMMSYRHEENNVYEDYEMLMCVAGCLGENHPEYVEDDDNIIVTYNESLYKKNQRIYGRSRNPFHHSRYGDYFSHNNSHRWQGEFEKIRPCELFYDIFQGRNLLGDWRKMLSIGKLWLDVKFMQRRIVQVNT